jgi:hypothetical protein
VSIFLITVVAIAIKLPVIAACWYIYKTIHDVPEPEIENDGGDFVRVDFEAGPRKRGPHGGDPVLTESARRGDKGHKESEPKPLVHSAPAGE